MAIASHTRSLSKFSVIPKIAIMSLKALKINRIIFKLGAAKIVEEPLKKR